MSKRIAVIVFALVFLVACVSLALSDRNATAQDSDLNGTESLELQMEFTPIAATGLKGTTTTRTKVPGGWLIAGKTSLQNDAGFGITFVPDASHVWDGSSL
ncbi:hypothetical protein [Novipirellula rosea]|uniref:Uncharacterized protein n=1 Tax=Novipirellula rosea TaxID=1031540 RepID=A0ABP8MDQ2_9BACT